MTTDFVLGRIKSFKREQGFGTITLDDGNELPFDVTVCDLAPEENARVRVQVGESRWGGKAKAMLVKLAEDVATNGSELALEQQISLVQANRLATDLTEEVWLKILEELGGDPATIGLLDVLDHYYTGEPARALSDGYLRHDWRFGQETDDVLAEIAALLPGAPVPRQLGWTERDTTELGYHERIATLQLARTDGGECTLDVRSLEDIIDFVNARLDDASWPKKLYSLDTQGDWHAYLALTHAAAQQLAKLLPFEH